MSTLLHTIENCPWWLNADGSVTVLCRGRVDNDGSGPAQGDRFHQGETTLKHADGTSLNSETEVFGVIPGIIARLVAPKVMGSKMFFIDVRTGRSVWGVAGDIGPDDRSGEGSEAMETALGYSPNPNTGGQDECVVAMTFWPGVAAPGYELQSL